MTFFTASIGTVTHRYFLMMAVIIVGILSGQFWIAFFGLPIFITAIAAISFTGGNQIQAEQKTLETRNKKINTAA